ncbi:uncharacterized protein LOC120204351 [Hibiscus syriacus]|uniref:uncharacterized protein LOC120204351 n=1 Tax=Hibiscus syriacus TaxID=106335 RepID=UPI001923D946|nr:uncharacterized protein LOC120204351 [Hibiscus syriacus]
MGCLVLPASLLRRRSMGYRPLTKEDAYGELDRRVAVRVLMKKDNGGELSDGKRRVMLVDVDAILFEHMLWLMNNDCSSLFQLNVEEILDFYSQEGGEEKTLREETRVFLVSLEPELK